MRRLFPNMFVTSLTAIALAGCNSNAPEHPTRIVSYVDCSPFASRIEKEEFYQHTKCGTIDSDGLIQLNAEVVALMDFPAFEKAVKNRNPEDLSMFPSHLQCLYFWPTIQGRGRGGLAYFNKDGRGRTTPAWDNRCLPFVEGLSFTYINGKVAYFDTDLNIANRTDYVFAFGRVVCSEVPHKYYKPGTYEHPEWRGGTCGKVDKNFDVVVPVKYAYEQVLTKGNENLEQTK